LPTKVQGQQEGLKLNGTHHLLVLVDDIVLLGKCIRGKPWRKHWDL